MKLSWQWVILAGALALAAGVGLSLNGQADERPLVSALWYEQARPLPEVELKDHSGGVFTNKQFKGRWTLMFLGYTSCPDVCPTTMADLARAYPKLQVHLTKSPLQVVLMSVDPGRDSQQKLADYVGFFNPEFYAITGEHSQLYKLSQSLGLMYVLVDNPNPDGTGEDYLVDHSADIVLINPEGAVEAVFRPEGGVGEIRKVSMNRLMEDYPVITGVQ
ncbi:SCO family protein [Ferrimonas marina]|uniref:Protein SCO1/2 n=1 Tax=Ferrimonas marina TaxID=299255 RepID=A0A1M5XTS5_9GAMM|nr:SCO family protein [Ferrimonas marina]SHI02944.1 protein SCO1/2 [Ferrimonas marina]